MSPFSFMLLFASSFFLVILAKGLSILLIFSRNNQLLVDCSVHFSTLIFIFFFLLTLGLVHFSIYSSFDCKVELFKIPLSLSLSLFLSPTRGLTYLFLGLRQSAVHKHQYIENPFPSISVCGCDVFRVLW